MCVIYWSGFMISEKFLVLTSSTCSQQVSRFVYYFRVITLRHTPLSVGLLWTRDRPVAETSTWQYKHAQETNIHARGGIRIHDPSKRSAADLCLRPRGHWHRQKIHTLSNNSAIMIVLMQQWNYLEYWLEYWFRLARRYVILFSYAQAKA
jgi:hypothetical protein